MMYSIVSLFVVLFLFFYILIRFNKLPYGFFVIFFVYSAFFQTISQPILEFGIYVTEQGRSSFYTGSTYRLLLLHSVFFFAIYFFLNINIKKYSAYGYRLFCVRGVPCANKYNNVLLYTLIIIGVVLICNALLSPSPIFNSSVTRFNFWETAKFPILKYIFGERSVHVFIVIGYLLFFYSIVNPSRLWLVSLLIFEFIFYQYLLGEKFTNQIIALMYLIVPFSVYGYYYRGSFLSVIKKNWQLILLLGVIGFGVVLYYYYSKYELKDVVGSPLLAILYRIFVLQGHTSWGLDYSYYSTGVLGFNKALTVIQDFNGDLMSFAMSVVSPASIYETYLDRGVRFSSAFPTVFMKLFGIVVTLIFLVVYAFLVSFIIKRAYINLIMFKYFLFVPYILILFHMFVFYNMGDIKVFIEAKFLLSVFTVLFIELIERFQRE